MSSSRSLAMVVDPAPLSGRSGRARLRCRGRSFDRCPPRSGQRKMKRPRPAPSRAPRVPTARFLGQGRRAVRRQARTTPETSVVDGKHLPGAQARERPQGVHGVHVVRPEPWEARRRRSGGSRGRSRTVDRSPRTAAGRGPCLRRSRCSSARRERTRDGPKCRRGGVAPEVARRDRCNGPGTDRGRLPRPDDPDPGEPSPSHRGGESPRDDDRVRGRQPSHRRIVEVVVMGMGDQNTDPPRSSSGRNVDGAVRFVKTRPIRSENTGSVRSISSPVATRTVAWPRYVTWVGPDSAAGSASGGPVGSGRTSSADRRGPVASDSQDPPEPPCGIAVGLPARRSLLPGHDGSSGPGGRMNRPLSRIHLRMGAAGPSRELGESGWIALKPGLIRSPSGSADHGSTNRRAAAAAPPQRVPRQRRGAPGRDPRHEALLFSRPGSCAPRHPDPRLCGGGGPVRLASGRSGPHPGLLGDPVGGSWSGATFALDVPPDPDARRPFSSSGSGTSDGSAPCTR